MKKLLVILLVIVLNLVCLTCAFAETSVSTEETNEVVAETVEATDSETAEEEVHFSLLDNIKDIKYMDLKKVNKTPAWMWVAIAIMAVAGTAMFVIYSRSQGSAKIWTTRKLALAAMVLALGTVLSLIRVAKMPMGGSVTPASMLPVMLFAYLFGPVEGIAVGIIYGILQIFTDGMSYTAMGVVANLFDYPIAFGLLGLAGIMGRKYLGKNMNIAASVAIGVIIGCAGRFLGSFISGWAFYGQYAGYYGFTSGAVYSAVYNIMYMLPECVICVLIGCLVGPRLVKALGKQAK